MFEDIPPQSDDKNPSPHEDETNNESTTVTGEESPVTSSTSLSKIRLSKIRLSKIRLSKIRLMQASRARTHLRRSVRRRFLLQRHTRRSRAKPRYRSAIL